MKRKLISIISITLLSGSIYAKEETNLEKNEIEKQIVNKVLNELPNEKFIKDEKKEKEEKIKKEIKRLKKEWEENPLECYSSVTNNTFPQCIINKKQNIITCETFVMKQIEKICTNPTIVNITNVYNKKYNKKVNIKKDKKLTKEFKKYLQQEFNLYKTQMFFMMGYRTGYFMAIKDIKKNKEIEEKIKKEKKIREKK